MSLNLSSASLRALVALTEKREKLLDELSAIEAKIASALNGASVGSAKAALRREGKAGKAHSAKPVKQGRKRSKRGAVKDLILTGLKEAGEAGIAVKDLAAKLAIKPQNLHVWLHTTGKKNDLVVAVSKGVYRLKEAIGVKTAQDSLKAPKPKAVRKNSKRNGRTKTSKS